MRKNEPSSRKRIGVVVAGLVGVALVALVGRALAGGGLQRLHGMHHVKGAMVRGHIENHVEHALNAVDASEEQREQIGGLVDRTFEALHHLHGDHEQEHARIAALLTAETVDRDALESLRAEHLVKIEQASRLIVDAVAQAAEVLTAEQRQQLVDLMRENHHCFRPAP